MWNTLIPAAKHPQTIFLLALFAYLHVILYVRYVCIYLCCSINWKVLQSVYQSILCMCIWKGSLVVVLFSIFHANQWTYACVQNTHSNQYSIDFISWLNIIFYRQHCIRLQQCICVDLYKYQSHQLLFLSITYAIPQFILRSHKATCTFRLISVLGMKRIILSAFDVKSI